MSFGLRVSFFQSPDVKSSFEARGNIPVMRTLYKVQNPSTNPEAEYYQPRIDQEFIGGKATFFVRETHAFWNDAKKRLTHKVMTYSPVEGFDNFNEAFARYHQQIDRRIKDGFVHSYQLNPYEKPPNHMVYELLR